MAKLDRVGMSLTSQRVFFLQRLPIDDEGLVQLGAAVICGQRVERGKLASTEPDGLGEGFLARPDSEERCLLPAVRRFQQMGVFGARKEMLCDLDIRRI